MRDSLLPANEIHVWSWPRVAGRDRMLVVLGGYLGRPLAERELACGPLGKPFIAGSALEFSVSHSASWTALAVGTAPVGLDIEYVTLLSDLDDVAAYALGPLERKALEACAPAERSRFFHRCWTRKEAYLKALGCGLSLAPREADTLQIRDWQLHEIELAGCAGCVATKIEGARLVYRSERKLFPDADATRHTAQDA